jgi:hypothetical protein
MARRNTLLAARAILAKPDTYRGWDITPPRWPVPWIAVAPDYDASWEGEEDGWVSSGGIVNAASREALLVEIDAYIEEHGDD